MLKKILNLSQVVFPLYFLVFTLSVGKIYKNILQQSMVVFPLYFLVFTLSVGRIYRSPGLVGASSVWYSTTNNIHVLTHHPASTQKHAEDIQRGRAHRQSMCLHSHTPPRKHTEAHQRHTKRPCTLTRKHKSLERRGRKS